MAAKSFPITGDDDADRLLMTEPLALLLGMMLDQQVPMEWAFRAPARLQERMGGTLNAHAIAALAPEAVEVLFKGPPALHRFPGSMGRRAQALCQHVVDHYHGEADRIWTEASSGDDLLGRLQALPGFGLEKSQIFVALLAKRMGCKPKGWQKAAGPFADVQPRSVADISSRAAFTQVREWKKLQKQQGKSKAD